MYLLCPSACKVLIAKLDFPEPETPVTLTILFFGITTSIFLRLFTLAPFMNIFSDIIKQFAKLNNMVCII